MVTRLPLGKKRRILQNSRLCYQDCWHTDLVTLRWQLTEPTIRVTCNVCYSLTGFNPCRLKGLQGMSCFATELGLCGIFFFAVKVLATMAGELQHLRADWLAAVGHLSSKSHLWLSWRNEDVLLWTFREFHQNVSLNCSLLYSLMYPRCVSISLSAWLPEHHTLLYCTLLGAMEYWFEKAYVLGCFKNQM